MAIRELPIYGLDIETDTATNGLDPRVGRILAVAVAHHDGERVFTDRNEAVLLDRVDWHLASLEPGVLATWNGSAFDLPYISDRARLHDVALGLHLVTDMSIIDRRAHLPGHPHPYRAHWHGHAHLDGYRLYRADTAAALGVSGSLKSIARVCGLAPVEVDRAAVHLLDPDELAAYVASDASCTRLLVARRWPACRGALDHIPATIPGCLPGAVNRRVLTARACRATARADNAGVLR